jgi:hypothetical protein
MSVYHLHIPRTSGVFVREFAINKSGKKVFSGHVRQFPESFYDYDFISGHFATTPIKYVDTNFAIFRNPVDLTFSYINYIRDKFYSDLSLEDLIENYLVTNKIENFVNINSKFLTGQIDVPKYNKNITNLLQMAENCWFVKNYGTEIESIVDTVQKNKTILVDFDNEEKYSRVSEILDIDLNGFKINESSIIEQNVIDKYNNLITELNMLDLEVWNYAKKQT